MHRHAACSRRLTLEVIGTEVIEVGECAYCQKAEVCHTCSARMKKNMCSEQSELFESSVLGVVLPQGVRDS